MNELASAVLVALGAAAVGLVTVQIRKAMFARRQASASSVDAVPRLPGHSLRAAIEVLEQRVRTSQMAAIAGVILYAAGYLLLTHFNAGGDPSVRLAILFVSGLLFTGWFLWQWQAVGKRLRARRLQLQGQELVGEALASLAAMGHRVFHDFPAGPFHIGHVVVGPVGVITVNTRAYAIPASRRRRQAPFVRYDGRMLHFPNNSDHRAIDQAKHQAAWFSDWLSQAVDDPIYARAIVTIPGWDIKRTSAEGIPVINPRQIPTLFEHLKPRPLTAAQLTHVTQCIEQHYHDAAGGEKKPPPN